MIKFFKRIRYNLMEQNNTAKYFKYAIGEIILVMVGILLALQVNNWNENRKNRQFESEIIALIDNNLLKDSMSLAVELKRAKLAISTTEHLLHEIDQGIYSDSLNYMMGKIINFQRFKSQSSAFEVLKSKGIENIRNKQLQLELITYYDEILFSVYESCLDVEKSFNTDWIPLIKHEFSDFKWLEFCVPIDSKSFFEKPSTIVLFKLFKDNRVGQVDIMEKAIAKITVIRNLIKSDTI
ncbi:hypothetical protein DI383_00655 [Flavobacteriaceae bacterium LYZ1037]|nr:hypothetical protein DI383_00655 [Flavobacteriaceae bacterium LYZ1037]